MLLQALLAGAVARPDTPIYALPLMENGSAVALEAFNQTDADFDSEATIQSLFEASADKYPSNACITGPGETLLYGDVEGLANQIAHLLMRLGVGKETAVGVMMERCPEMYVAMLAILKAGGCYIPIDAVVPAERVAFMLEDTRAKVLITHRDVTASVPLGNALQARFWPLLPERNLAKWKLLLTQAVVFTSKVMRGKVPFEPCHKIAVPWQH